MSMKRLTKYGKTSHENGVCCTHFNSKECNEVAGNCALNCKWEEAAWSKLAAYEDAEEQGLLVMLPCKVEDTLYEASIQWKEVLIRTVAAIVICNNSIWVRNGCGDSFEYGVEVFLTREEAEAALAEMEG